MSSAPYLPAAPHAAARGVFTPSIPLFGLDIAAVSFDTALDVLCAAAMQRDGRARVAVTPNVDHVVRLDSQPEFKRLYQTADFLFADGMPVVWASHLFGPPLPGRVTGSDLLPALCERARAGGWKVVVVGGRPGHEAALVNGFAQHYPGLDITVIAPSMTFDPTGPEGAAVAERVSAAAPDIVFVCVGMPKQERWALHHADKLPGGLMLCAGAAVEFAVGLRERAPAWMQRCGLEWCWRVMQDPARLWRRYLVDDRRFFGILWRHWRVARTQRRAA
ncbi:N-acetylglucosaminyldiphosphoundecaprenol N-acetyl-beta-D-mannosaminyltransferase [Paraburkholderia unamae]|uniref:WecB/TagA/CpsF family glycosyltransferase n=1 Tax=Paraburkholderia unamae TaxID=219649 RepID=UPI000DD467CF|nr:WecB/TagA/CpsF family glycosyltransferase [Paraburkholderia unamae]CAG9262865.1 N-acetylglucosaminyldiphosphoundecaprenol N-acetyl-beta-D-mannosaminyltransferase [Paraburkholderia unamae]